MRRCLEIDNYIPTSGAVRWNEDSHTRGYFPQKKALRRWRMGGKMLGNSSEPGVIFGQDPAVLGAGVRWMGCFSVLFPLWEDGMLNMTTICLFNQTSVSQNVHKTIYLADHWHSYFWVYLFSSWIWTAPETSALDFETQVHQTNSELEMHSIVIRLLSIIWLLL